MTKATKKKLNELNKTIGVLESSQAGKGKTITFLIVGIIGVGAVVMFFVFRRRRRG